MKLSVIIVTYNVRNYLEQAINSCLNQNYQGDFEIIIGDDGSSDGTIDIIKEYTVKFPEIIKYFIMDRSDVTDLIPSIRVTNVLRRAFEMAKGEYITCMAGDDYFSDLSKFETQVDFLEKNKTYQSCYTDYRKVWDNGEKIDFHTKKVISRAIFWSKYYIHVSCYVFRRSVFSSLPDRFFDDTGLIFAMLKTGKCFHIPNIMFDYRQRDNSIMHESDNLELNILELLLYQDITNSGGFKMSSLARFYKPLKNCFKRRQEIKNDKYKKYVKNSSLHKNDILGKLSNFDDISLICKFLYLFLLIRAFISYCVFYVLSKINRVIAF